MAKELTPKGSIIYKFLILVLAVALVLTIIYPKQLWDMADKETKICQEHMDHILYAELTYLSENNAYNDTLAKVVEFIKNDSTGARLRTFMTADSVLTLDIYAYFQQGSDSVAKSLVDSLRDYGRRYDLDTTAALVFDSLRVVDANYGEKIDSIAFAALEAMFNCPSTNEGYVIEVNNDSTFKKISITCPIDSTDILAVKKDFVKSTLGGYKLENHGSINENGEKSWQK